MTMGSKYPNARLHHLQLTGDNPKELANFYASALNMEVSEVDGGYLCTGPHRQVLFTKGPKRKTGYAGFAFATADALTAYQARLDAKGLEILPSPSALFDDTAFAVRDPDGNVTVFGTSEQTTPDATDQPDARLQHLTLRTVNLPPMIEHYANKLEFFLSDLVSADNEDDLRTAFFASDPEHHSLAVFKAPEARLDHHSYELSGWDQVRDWADHFSDLGLTLRWGPGRHGPGNNLFIFLEDPEGNWIELSAELEVMDETREVGTWPHSARSLNLWGNAIMRS